MRGEKEKKRKGKRKKGLQKVAFGALDYLHCVQAWPRQGGGEGGSVLILICKRLFPLAGWVWGREEKKERSAAAHPTGRCHRERGSVPPPPVHNKRKKKKKEKGEGEGDVPMTFPLWLL